MALNAKNINNKQQQEEPERAPSLSSVDVVRPTLELTREDVQILLIAIRDTSFKGEHVEMVYNLVSKLQQHYMTVNR